MIEIVATLPYEEGGHPVRDMYISASSIDLVVDAVECASRELREYPRPERVAEREWGLETESISGDPLAKLLLERSYGPLPVASEADRIAIGNRVARLHRVRTNLLECSASGIGLHAPNERGELYDDVMYGMALLAKKGLEGLFRQRLTDRRLDRSLSQVCNHVFTPARYAELPRMINLDALHVLDPK